MISPWLSAMIIVVVTIAFAVTFGLQFVVPDYEPETAIYGLFGAIVAATFAQRRRNGDGS